MSMTTLPLRDFQTLARFRRSLRTFLHFSEQAARQAGLTPSQHQLLLMIKGFDQGQPSVGDAAEWLGLRHHSAVELVDARPLLPGVPDLGAGPSVQLWPHRHGTDAMFLALLRRVA